MNRTIITTIALFLVLVMPVVANTVVRTGDQVSMTNEQNVAGNFYAVGNSVVMSGDSNQDLTMIGGKVRLDGSVARCPGCGGDCVDRWSGGWRCQSSQR